MPRLAVLFGPIMRGLFLGLLAILVCLGPGCSRPAAKPLTPTADAYISDPDSVGFDIVSLHRQNGSLVIQGTYASEGKMAKFGVEFAPSKPLESKNSTDAPMEAGQGRFVAEPGSDAAVLLVDLQKALEAKAVPQAVQRVRALPFTYVNIGDNLSQAPVGGGFNTKPVGGWTATKIFIGEGEQEGELFLNFNPAIAKGQFSIKDPDYGDIVLRQLASVL